MTQPETREDALHLSRWTSTRQGARAIRVAREITLPALCYASEGTIGGTRLLRNLKETGR